MAKIPGPSANGKWYVDATNNANVFTKVWLQDKGIDSNTILGPYATENDAKEAATGLVGTKILKGWDGLIAELQVGATAVGSVGGIGNPLTGLAAIGDFFGRLSEANTWLRVGEVLIGIILLGIGVARITGAQNIVSTAVKARIP